MAQYLGKGVSHIFGSEGYNYSKVVFNKGKPVLDAELNLMQELQEMLARRSTAEMCSGWITKRPAKASSDATMLDSFLTQDPTGAIPEVALINGWTVMVSNTGTESNFVNKVDLSVFPLIKGSRVDGVFLEAWRSVVSDEFNGITSPSDVSVVTSVNSVWALSATKAWAVGNNGVVLYSDNAGVTWVSQQSPSSSNLNAVYFFDDQNGYIAGDGGSLFRTDNGGVTWGKIPLSITDDLLSISGILPSNLWVCGKNGAMVKSSDGETFRQVAAGIVSSDLKSVFFYDTVVGWTCGASGAYLKTNDGGESWSRVQITVPDSLGVERSVTASLNGVNFVNLSDGWIVGDQGLILRTTDGGLRWGDTSYSVYDSTTSSYSRMTTDLYAIEVVKSFPLRINLALFDSSYFKAASYTLSATELALRYTRRSDNAVFTETLSLATYSTDAQLVSAINALRTSDNRRIYTATLGYTEANYESHETSGSIYDSASTDIKFSLGDRAWIVGQRGTILTTANSGAQWVIETSGTSFDLKDTSFFVESSGFAVGAQGIVLHNSSSVWSAQSTDLVTKAQKKVYFEGNQLASVNKNLNFDSISPELLIPTADRVQIQYRIRVVEGVDIANFQEAGLGSTYTYSLGPNGTVLQAGSYSYENMGAEVGDYGLWRARCRNTVDGYSYAIPMFLVSRRNSSPYDANNNINGSTYVDLNVVRPDGLSLGEITSEDIVDIRKTVSTVDYEQHLQGALDLVLSNKLRTRMHRNPEFGTQVGTSVIYKDTYATPEELSRLALQGVSSAAIGGLTGFAGPQDGTGIVADITGLLPSQSELTFPVLPNSIWHHEPEKFSAIYTGTGEPLVDNQPIPGGFTGLGTSTAMFVLGATGVLNGADNQNLAYLIAGQRIDYNGRGLSKLPDMPLSTRNLDGNSVENTVYYRSFREDAPVQVAQEFASAVNGLKDFVEILPIYSNNPGVPTSSAVRVHIFQQPADTTQVLRVPKDFNGFTVYSVEAVIGSNSTLHRIAYVKDREIPAGSALVDASNLVITLEDTFRIPAGNVVEIILGVNEVPATPNGLLDTAVLGVYGSDRGETPSSFSNPNISVINPRVKSVEGFYRSVLVQSSTSNGSSAVTISAPTGSVIVGLAAYPTLVTPSNYYVWYTTNTISDLTNPSVNASMTSVALDMTKDITGFGTNSLSFSLVSGQGGIPLNAQASIMAAIYVQDSKLENSSTTSSAEVYYRSVVPQAIDNLPSSMNLEVLNISSKLYVSSLGNGGGIGGEYYPNVMGQLAVNDSSITTESQFFNLSGLKMSGYTEDEGLATLPTTLSRTVGGTLTLSNPTSDSFGRFFYQNANVPLIFKAQPLTLGNPRKVFVPMLVKVTSNVVSPALRGEVLLAIVSRSLNTELENLIRFDSNNNGSAVALYRIPGMPLTRG